MARPSKPTASKVIQGTFRQSRANGSEPEPLIVSHEQAETPPSHLDADSAAVWVHIAPMLRSTQVLTVADLLALEILCNQVADMRRARAQRAGGLVAETRTGSYMLSQLLIAEQMTAKHAAALMGRFGMDPQSRARLMIQPQGDLFGAPPKDGPARFFKT